MDKRDFATVAFVSGKGGVGKTTLAANFAWLLHRSNARVILIDLDFQNLGATGLFSALYELGPVNAFDLLHNPEKLSGEVISLSRLEEGLWFLPGSFMQASEESDHTLEGVFESSARIRERLEQLLEQLHAAHGFDCIVLDCHGGIDPTSIAAAGICDHTLIITEADTVTFSGTLALLDSYLKHYEDSVQAPNISYVINRIPPKYRWRDLDGLYERYLHEHLGRYTASKGALSYIPAEDYLTDSFGEYPFQVALAPKALFTRKLELMVYDLFMDSKPALVAPSITRHFNSKRRVRRVAQTVLSSDATNVRAVFAAFGVTALYAFLFIPLMVYSAANSHSTHSQQIDPSQTFAGAMVTVGIVVLLILVRAAFRVFFHFRDRLKFRKALFAVVPQHRSGWRRMELWKLRMLYCCSALGPLTVLVYILPTLVLALAPILEKFDI